MRSHPAFQDLAVNSRWVRRQQSASRLLLSLDLGPRKPHRERFPLGGHRRMDVTEGRVKTEQEGSGYGGPGDPLSPEWCRWQFGVQEGKVPVRLRG